MTYVCVPLVSLGRKTPKLPSASSTSRGTSTRTAPNGDEPVPERSHWDTPPFTLNDGMGSCACAVGADDSASVITNAEYFNERISEFRLESSRRRALAVPT